MKLFERKYQSGSFLFPRFSAMFSLFFACIIYSAFSCTPTKSTTYFADISDAERVKLPDLKRPEPVIMPDDMLEIKIVGANELTTQVINTFGGMSAAGGNVSAPIYTVDRNGEIEFAFIGKIKAEGLTKDELRNKVKAEMGTYLKDAIVAVRFTNFRVTVLGEVRVPGSYLLATDKVTILEALGQAGDMTQYAVPEKVHIIRDSSGKREIGKIDFTQKTVFSSPYYYLQRNDVVYIETNKNKTKNEQFSRASSLVATFTSIIAIAITIFRR